MLPPLTHAFQFTSWERLAKLYRSFILSLNPTSSPFQPGPGGGKRSVWDLNLHHFTILLPSEFWGVTLLVTASYSVPILGPT